MGYTSSPLSRDVELDFLAVADGIGEFFYVSWPGRHFVLLKSALNLHSNCRNVAATVKRDQPVQVIFEVLYQSPTCALYLLSEIVKAANHLSLPPKTGLLPPAQQREQAFYSRRLEICCQKDVALMHPCHETMPAQKGENTVSNEQGSELGRYIQAARLERNMSLHQLARAADVDRAMITRLERGLRGSPGPEKIARIAEALGLDLSQLYERAGIPVPELPSFTPYLRTKYGQLPTDVLDQIETYAAKLARPHGVNISGPAPGEDEAPEP